MRYTARITRRQYQKTPLLLRFLGTDFSQNAILRPGGLSVWQIIYSVNGTGEFCFDEQRCFVQPGQLALISPYEKHSYQSKGQNWTVHYLGFHGSACRALLSSMRLEQSSVYSLAHPEQLTRHIRALEQIAADDQPDKNLRCSKELYSTLLDLSLDVTKVPQATFSEAPGIAREIRYYLEEHYAEEVSLEVLAAHFHLAPEYLCERFKAETHQTIMKTLRGIRIHHAKIKLLEMPDIGLAEVGRLCGFRSPSYFGKVFRESTGFTPQAYRLGAYL